MSYSFGVEIEIIALPILHWYPYPLEPRVYYASLAAALRSCGLAADADSLAGRYRKHPEHYDKWWITKDGSLGDPSPHGKP